MMMFFKDVGRIGLLFSLFWLGLACPLLADQPRLQRSELILSGMKALLFEGFPIDDTNKIAKDGTGKIRQTLEAAGLGPLSGQAFYRKAQKDYSGGFLAARAKIFEVISKPENNSAAYPSYQRYLVEQTNHKNSEAFNRGLIALIQTGYPVENLLSLVHIQDHLKRGKLLDLIRTSTELRSLDEFFEVGKRQSGGWKGAVKRVLLDLKAKDQKDLRPIVQRLEIKMEDQRGLVIKAIQSIALAGLPVNSALKIMKLNSPEFRSIMKDVFGKEMSGQTFLVLCSQNHPQGWIGARKEALRTLPFKIRLQKKENQRNSEAKLRQKYIFAMQFLIQENYPIESSHQISKIKSGDFRNIMLKVIGDPISGQVFFKRIKKLFPEGGWKECRALALTKVAETNEPPSCPELVESLGRIAS